MPVQTAAAGAVTFTGHDATNHNASEVLAGRVQFTGHAALNFGAPPAASDAPDALRLEFTTTDGTQLVNDFAQRRNLTFVVEHNGTGHVSFETDVDAFADGIEDALLDPNNLVRVHLGDMDTRPFGVAEGFITAAPPAQNTDGSWSLPVQCPGTWDALDFGVIWPPPGAVGETREFSYTAGMTGPSWVPEEWGTPVGKNVKDSFRWTENRRPSGWPESQAEWLWSSNPDKSEILKYNPFSGEMMGYTCHFVGSFTNTERNEFLFNVAGDDTLDFYIDGAKVKDKPQGAWHSNTAFKRWLDPGTHVISAAVRKKTSTPSGFLCAIARLKPNGEHGAWVLRSSPSTFQIKKADGYFAQVPLPPDGWYPAAVLHQQVTEAAARGVDFHSDITLTFSQTADSDGSAWTTKGPAEYEIGLSSAQLGEKVRAGGVDLAMLPGLKLGAWKRRGFDLRDRVTISKPLDVRWPSRVWARVRTVALTHHETGWTETSGDAGLLAEYGRRELPLSGGGVADGVQADVFAQSAMSTAASPEVTIEFDTTTAAMVGDNPTPMPFRDYDVADIITVATIGGFQAMKVMTITGAEQDDKSVKFTTAGYPV